MPTPFLPSPHLLPLLILPPWSHIIKLPIGSLHIIVGGVVWDVLSFVFRHRTHHEHVSPSLWTNYHFSLADLILEAFAPFAVVRLTF